jgi:hypothetical protein
LSRLALILVAIAAAASAGCDGLECGLGTAERDGACVPADGVSPDDPQCGAGTVFDPVALACVPERPPTECGPNTEAVEREDGVIECVGTGTSCADPLPCPLPDGGDVSICGRLLDTETTAPIVFGDGTDTSVCDPANPTADGPCALQLVFVDAIAFATNPGTATPLSADGSAPSAWRCRRAASWASRSTTRWPARPTIT